LDLSYEVEVTEQHCTKHNDNRPNHVIKMTRPLQNNVTGSNHLTFSSMESLIHLKHFLKIFV